MNEKKKQKCASRVKGRKLSRVCKGGNKNTVIRQLKLRTWKTKGMLWARFGWKQQI